MLPFVDAFEVWNLRRQTDEYRALCEGFEDAGSPTFDDVWLDFFSRRVGKTGKWIVQLSEIAINRREALLTYFTAKFKDIGEIVVPLAKMIMKSDRVPKEWQPEFYRSKGEHTTPLLYFPSTESIIKLVGVDSDPDALRGRYSDGMVGSEVAFMRASGVDGLEDTTRSVLLPQFQGRPWAFLAFETSAPRDPDHPVLTLFKPDAERRGALCEGTLDINTSLSARDKRKYIREAGGRGHPTCEREYYNVVTRDAEQYVFPEFDAAEHVREWTRPKHAYSIVAADPGSRDLFGLVGGYYDFEHAKAVIEWSWARQNASTRMVACVVSYFEHKHWGRWPETRMQGIPLTRQHGKDGWRELLAGVATAEECADLQRMADTDASERPREVWRAADPPADRLSYWDGDKLVQGPHVRVTDVDLRLIADLQIEYGINFGNTAKDDVDAQRDNLRIKLGASGYVFLPGCGPVIDHVKNAIWDAKRKDFQRHPLWGHYDCASCLTYLNRNLPRLRNPFVPAHALIDPATQNVAFLPPPPKSREANAIEQAFGRPRGGVVIPRGWR